MAEKGVVMVLKVDLQCPSCYKRIKKILCKFPQIRGQVFDVKQNTVTITVVCCCSPEKFREKLCCKGRKVIKSIEIKRPPSPKKTPKPDDQPPPPPPPVKKTPKPDDQQPPPVKKTPKLDDQPPPPPPVRTCCEQCAQGYGGGPCFYGYGHGAQPAAARTCCEQCAQGYGGGPCFYGYGHVAPPPPARCYYDGYYYAYGYGCGRCRHAKCVCFIEENPSSCVII